MCLMLLILRGKKLWDLFAHFVKVAWIDLRFESEQTYLPLFESFMNSIWSRGLSDRKTHRREKNKTIRAMTIKVDFTKSLRYVDVIIDQTLVVSGDSVNTFRVQTGRPNDHKTAFLQNTSHMHNLPRLVLPTLPFRRHKSTCETIWDSMEFVNYSNFISFQSWNLNDFFSAVVAVVVLIEVESLLYDLMMCIWRSLSFSRA